MPLLVGSGQSAMKFSISKNIFEYLLLTWFKSRGHVEDKESDKKNFNEDEVKAELEGLIENINSVVKK